jgi:hypothetical protein
VLRQVTGLGHAVRGSAALAGIMLRSSIALGRGWAVDLLVEYHMQLAIGFEREHTCSLPSAKSVSKHYAREFCVHTWRGWLDRLVVCRFKQLTFFILVGLDACSEFFVAVCSCRLYTSPWIARQAGVVHVTLEVYSLHVPRQPFPTSSQLLHNLLNQYDEYCLEDSVLC